jgi:hypothetical protein
LIHGMALARGRRWIQANVHEVDRGSSLQRLGCWQEFRSRLSLGTRSRLTADDESQEA